MRRTLRTPLRVVFYREDDAWVAHCLEFDLVGTGSTAETALKSLSEAIRIQVEATLREEAPGNLFFPADGKYFEMFAAGRPIAIGELKLHFEQIEIEGSDNREYSEDDLVPA